MTPDYTWRDLAKDVGKEHGLILSDEQADAALWNFTGFPSFWKSDPIEECRAQLQAAFKRVDL